MPGALVELQGVVKRFGDVAGAPEVLSGVDLQVAAGETVAVVGPSGSGKSTLLNVMGTLLPPTGGRVLFEGKDLAGMDAGVLATLRNRKIGFVFQSHHLLPQCTALENVLVPTLAERDPGLRTGAEERARDLLTHVGLEERLDHRPARLSGGECQRVAVVRALINGPDLLLADEPTGSLDEDASVRLADLLLDMNAREGVAVVTVTHSRALAARMGRTLEILDGRITTHSASDS